LDVAVFKKSKKAATSTSSGSSKGVQA